MPEADNLLAGGAPEGGTPAGGAPEGGTPAGGAPAGETPEAKAAREAGETPEAKAEREAAEQKAKDEAVPEAYEFKMPDGIDLDTAAVEEFSALAKELELSQAKAQKVVEVGARMVQRQLEAHAAMVASWAKQVREDTELGGDKLDENVAVARDAVKTLGGEALRKVLFETGLGNHPEMVRAFVKVGRAIKQDGFLRGGTTTSTGGRAPEAAMFPSMQKTN